MLKAIIKEKTPWESQRQRESVPTYSLFPTGFQWMLMRKIADRAGNWRKSLSGAGLEKERGLFCRKSRKLHPNPRSCGIKAFSY